MDLLSFISSLVNSLIWPIVVLIVVLVLKQPISKLLFGISRVKYKEIEMDFGSELSELEKTVNSVKDKLKVPNFKNSITERHAEIKTIAETSPNASITMTWLMVEKEIIATINRLQLSSEDLSENMPIKNIEILVKNSLIDGQTFVMFNDLRKLRNKAAHNIEEVISYVGAIKYYEIAVKVVDRLLSLQK